MTDRRNIENKVLELFKEHTQLAVELDTDLQNLGVNSLVFVQFIVALEDAFNYGFEDQYLNMRNLTYLSHIVDLICSDKNI